jgi:hypothetical protein
MTTTLNPVETRNVTPAPDRSTHPGPATATAAPVPPRAAVAILGTMILLILMLTAILVDTTWVNPASASQGPPAEPGAIAQR